MIIILQQGKLSRFDTTHVVLFLALMSENIFYELNIITKLSTSAIHVILRLSTCNLHTIIYDLVNILFLFAISLLIELVVMSIAYAGMGLHLILSLVVLWLLIGKVSQK